MDDERGVYLAAVQTNVLYMPQACSKMIDVTSAQFHKTSINLIHDQQMGYTKKIGDFIFNFEGFPDKKLLFLQFTYILLVFSFYQLYKVEYVFLANIQTNVLTMLAARVKKMNRP